jgi:hypothetical protein
MNNASAPTAKTPAKSPAAWRARLNGTAAALTHSVFVLVLALVFVRGGEPQATVKQAPSGAERLAEAPSRTAALPSPPPQSQEREEPGGAVAPTPDAAAPADDEFQLAARSRRSPREPKEEPAPAPVTPLPTPPRSSPAQARANMLMARLVSAYQDFFSGHDDNNLIWRDGSKMGFDDGAEKSFQERLEHPDIEDMFAVAYPLAEMLSDPEPDFDPGRFRNEAFFTKMYGDCRRDREVQKRLVDVVWLPKTGGGRKIKATPINGVATRLQQVSDELDALPPEFLKYLRPTAGTFNCRDIVGTSRSSAHGFGIAIDLNSAQGDYWEDRGRSRRDTEPLHYRNRIPNEIVAIFEKHGFIWGGKWYHYDTAHFEYRPELLFPEDTSGGEAAVPPMPEKQPRNLN